MPLRDLLRSTWNILRNCRLLWLMAMVYVAYTYLLNPVIPSRASSVLLGFGFACISIISAFIASFSGFGMIYAVERYIAGQPASLKEAWQRFLSYFVNLFLTSLFFFLSAALLCVILYFFLHLVLYYGLYYASVHWTTTQRTAIIIPIIFLVLMLIMPIFELSCRSVYLGHLSPLRSLWDGCQVFFKNFWLLTGTSLISVCFLLLLQVVVSFVYFTAINSPSIDTLASATLLQRWLTVTSTPPARAVGFISAIFAVPFLSTLMTLIYIKTAPPVTSPDFHSSNRQLTTCN